jgi:cobalt ECF transporter T component CbiQ
MSAVDDVAFSSPMRHIAPLGKLLLCLSLLIASLASSTIIVPSMVLLIGLSMIAYGARGRVPRAVGIALLDSLFVLLVSALLIALMTGGTVVAVYEVFGLKVTFTQEGFEIALSLILKVLAGMSVMLAFALTTPIPHLAIALRQLRVPNEVCEVMVLIYRYAFLLLEQLEAMRLAAEVRLGFRGARRRLRTSGKMAVGVFTRSLEMAERSEVALRSRAFRGEFRTYREPGRMVVLWYVIPSALFLALFALNLLLVQVMKVGF